MTKAFEVNFDGLVGPTHNYGGLSYGNLASMKNKRTFSQPKQGALQGLKKMKFLMDLGVPQAVLPPQERPSIAHLHALGFRGSDRDIIQQAAKEAPSLLQALSSASAMWMANAATMSPSVDTYDNKVHITIANQLNRFHRSIEAEERIRLFQLIFSDRKSFTIHPPLPKGGDLGDEGAANQTRFCRFHGEKGVYLFGYGKELFKTTLSRFPARQALEASQAIARQHGLPPAQIFFVQQNPELIDLGVFHNDLVSVGHRNVFLYHAEAFKDIDIKKLKETIERVCECPFHLIKVTEEIIPLKQAIETYFFNSQLVTLPDETIALVAEERCRTLSTDWLPFPIFFTDLKQSMKNGGGPACLRLRIVLTDEERKKVHAPLFLTESLYQTLVEWVERYYRDKLFPSDLADPHLHQESQEALDQLTKLLGLPPFYSFQY